jgi:hypothetical protein
MQRLGNVLDLLLAEVGEGDGQLGLRVRPRFSKALPMPVPRT